ncbi:hypothetical protein FB451DRAFT_972765, partial [Mycena latifolia]
MIALCRAKCWIIQLREDGADARLPIAQRGVRGHIIVYPQHPSAVAKSLPPSVSDIVTPVCVIFVGAKAPSPEWLKTKATPLIVRKEKVAKALEWLKIHNHLYRKVLIDRDVLNSLPEESILPFHVQHVVPNAGIDSTTSDYVPGSHLPPSVLQDPNRSLSAGAASAPNLPDILPPVPDIPFQSVVVADVNGNAPSDELKAVALKHMEKAGSNYLEIPHDPKPVNEFKNRHLFPMMYPTLFPYGLGGLEDSNRCAPISFKRHIKH